MATARKSSAASAATPTVLVTVGARVAVPAYIMAHGALPVANASAPSAAFFPARKNYAPDATGAAEFASAIGAHVTAEQSRAATFWQSVALKLWEHAIDGKRARLVVYVSESAIFHDPRGAEPTYSQVCDAENIGQYLSLADELVTLP